MGFSRYQNVLKEIIFRKREYQEYITPQNFGSGVFLLQRYGSSGSKRLVIILIV